jgi:hypothetical protein
MIKASRREDEYMVMLVDSFTVKVLNSCVKLTDVVEAGVSGLTTFSVLHADVSAPLTIVRCSST